MCDPTVLAIGSMVAGVAGQAANYFGAQSAQNAQKKEYEAWAANQSRIRAAENVRQDTLRKDASAAQAQGLDQISAENQKKAQADEEARLSSYLQGQDQQNTPDPAAPVSIADKTLSGQSTMGDPQFQSDIAKKINDATASSKQRIAALARVQSYGGSQGGLDRTVADAFQQAGSGIDQANDARRGSLGAYGTERAVDPIQINYTPSPLANMASSLFSAGAQGLGGAFAGTAGVTGTGSIPTTVKYGNVNYKMF